MARCILTLPRAVYSAFNARFSPDEKWICFIGTKNDDADAGAIFVVPAAGGEWIPITESSEFNDKPRWSPDGRTIYFISSRSGFSVEMSECPISNKGFRCSAKFNRCLLKG